MAGYYVNLHPLEVSEVKTWDQFRAVELNERPHETKGLISQVGESWERVHGGGGREGVLSGMDEMDEISL